MGSKGQSVQNQTGYSNYSANPLTQGAASQALGQAQTAASSPFNLPVAPVAGLNATQNQAFGQIGQEQGMAQPYYNQAQSLFNQSAAPISSQQVNNYLNPYASNVISQLQSQQGQQMASLTGQATQQAGGVGADRIGVAQSQLANQQNLATGQTLSGIYGSALSAAQQQNQMEQSAAYGIGNLGGAAQNSALQGSQALLGAGNQQQQQTQTELNAPYQNQLAQIAFPYQQAQYLSGITGSLAGALGGTTMSNQAGNATAAPPSIYSQIAGLGTGLTGAVGAYNSLGKGSGSSVPNTGAINNSLATLNNNTGGNYYGPGFADGGATSGAHFAPGGAADATGGSSEPSWMTSDPTIPTIAMHASQVQQPKITPLNMGSGSGSSSSSSSSIGSDISSIAGAAAKIIPLFAARGGAVDTQPYQSFADGGADNTPDFGDRFADAATMGDLPLAVAQGHYPVGSPQNPYRQPAVKADGSPIAPPDTMQPDGTSSAATPSAAPAASPTGMAALSPAAAQTAAANQASMQGTNYKVPYGDLDQASDTSRSFAKSPWLALMNAGFGIAAGTSPYAGVNIGKGLQEGAKTLENQRKDLATEEGVNQRAKQLAMEADQHLRQYTQLTPAQAATIENEKKKREFDESKLEESGWQKGAENLLTGDTTYFNPRSQESGVLKRDGTWVKGGAPQAGTTAASSATPPPAPQSAQVGQATPPALAPLGVPALASNLEAPKTDIGYIGKGSPLGAASTKDIQTTIAAQNKAAVALPQLEQDLTTMKLAYKTLTKDADKDGFLSRIALQPGADFGARLEKAKQANALAVAAGEKPPFDPDKVAAAENINKIQNRMGLTFSSQISPREAFAGQKIGIESSPGLTNSPKGFQRLIAGFDAAVNNTRDEQAFFQNYLKKNGTSLGWRQAFEQQNPSERYVVRGLMGMLPDNLKAGLPEAIQQLKSDPAKYKDTFNKYYNDTADYFLKAQ